MAEANLPDFFVESSDNVNCSSDNELDGLNSLTANEIWYNSVSFNFSQHAFPGKLPVSRSLDFVEHFKIFIYLITLIVALIGNTAVLLAVFQFRSLRGAVNLYLANLALADILICICCMWVYLVTSLTAPAYVLGPLICRFGGFIQMTCLTSSVLTLSAISCDRYMAIKFPLRSRVTKKRTDVVIAAIWIFSLFISIPFFLFRKLNTFQWSDYTETNCLEAWPSASVYSPDVGHCVKKHTFKRVYYTLVSTILFFVPALIIVTVYGSIIIELSSHRNLPPSFSQSGQFSAIRHRAKRKVIKMSCIICLSHIICWLPLQIIVLYSIYFHSSHSDGALPEWFSKLAWLATYLAYSNSALVPAIYGRFDRRFRLACRSMFCCLCKTIKQSSGEDTKRNNKMSQSNDNRTDPKQQQLGQQTTMAEAQTSNGADARCVTQQRRRQLLSGRCQLNLAPDFGANYCVSSAAADNGLGDGRPHRHSTASTSSISSSIFTPLVSSALLSPTTARSSQSSLQSKPSEPNRPEQTVSALISSVDSSQPDTTERRTLIQPQIVHQAEHEATENQVLACSFLRSL